MSFEESLQHFFDGTLGESDLAELFHTISASEDKRAEFIKASQLRSAFVEDSAVRRLRPELAQRTLRAALAREPSRATVPLVAGAGQGNRAILPIVLAIGLTLGGLFGYSIGESGSNTLKSIRPVKENQSVGEVQPQLRAERRPLHRTTKRNRSRGTHNSAYALALARQSNHMATNMVGELEHDTELPHQVVRTVEDVLPASSPSIQSTPRATPLTRNSSTEEINQSVQSMPMAAIGDNRINKFEIDLAEGIKLVQSQINSANLTAPPTFNMFRLHAGMNLDEGTSIGVLIGQSVFAVKYADQPDLFTLKTYSQFLSVTYGGMYVQRLLPIVSGFVPTVSLGAGASSFGVLGSLELGATLPIAGSFHAFSGVHGDMLLYKHVGTWYGGETLSFVAGIGAGF